MDLKRKFSGAVTEDDSVRKKPKVATKNDRLLQPSTSAADTTNPSTSATIINGKPNIETITTQQEFTPTACGMPLLETSTNKKGSSDELETAEKIIPTIIIPDFPEEGKKETQMLSGLPQSVAPREFQEHPLNLRMIPNPMLPVPQNPQTPIQNTFDNLSATHFGNAPVPSIKDNEGDAEVQEPDDSLIYPLMEVFPEACPQYIINICEGKKNNPGVLDDLISQILANDYPKIQKAPSPIHTMDSAEQLAMLKEILPDADPNYLQIQCDWFVDKPEEMKVFIANAIENPTYPKLKDYLRRQQISAQQRQYTNEFNVENFLEIIPDPETYFKDPKRNQITGNIESQHYAITFLRNRFYKIPLRMIRDIFKQNDSNFLPTLKALEELNPNQHNMKTRRAPCHMPEVIQNIPLLQEIAFVEHRDEIKEYLRLQNVKEERERAEMSAAGLMETCSCCFDEHVMPKHIYTCENGCIFCRECVQRGAEVSFGDGKLDFSCLNDCTSHFSLKTLQAVLNPKLFSKIAIKKQLEEVKAAGIEDLEMCPFCDFSYIPARDDKLFRCLNPDCMKESCRQCKEPSHVPLRCDEVEKDEEVKTRTFIENKMTEALLRTCYKCNKKFIKTEGCNKMTCPCGAFMCYVCGKPVKDYKHFNGDGGNQYNLCPLFSNTNNLHKEAVLKGAEEAKKEMGVDANPKKLKNDPAADVEQYYKEIATRRPPVAPLRNLLGAIAGMARNLRVQDQQQNRRRRQQNRRDRHQRQHRRGRRNPWP